MDSLQLLWEEVSKHVLYSDNNCRKEITENSENIVRPHLEVIVCDVIGSVGQPS